MTAVPATKVSYAEYLTAERASETKHEYVNGEIPGLQAYVLASQDEPRIESFRRDGARWIYEEAGPGESLRIGGVEVDVSVDALYASALPAAGGTTTGGAS